MPKDKKKKKLSSWNLAVRSASTANPDKSFKQVIQIAKKNFGKNPTKNPIKKGNPVKRRTTMARRKRSRRSKSFTLPLAVVGGLANGLARPAQLALEGNVEQALMLVGARYTGFDMRSGKGSFNLSELGKGLGSLVVGLAVHKFVGGPPLNGNRVLAATGIPFIRI